MLELFLLMPFWFWAFVVFAWVVLTVATEYDSPGWGGLFVIGCLAFFQFVAGVPVFQWVWNNPFSTGCLFLLYFFLGTGWSVNKWYFFVCAELRTYNEKVRDAWLVDIAKLPPGKVPESRRAEFVQYLERVYGPNYVNRIRPLAKNHKGQIMTWIGFWPFSALWTILNDPLRRLVESIYNHIAAFIQRISDYVFRNALKDMTPAPVDQAPIPDTLSLDDFNNPNTPNATR